MRLTGAEKAALGTAAVFFAATIISAAVSMASGTTFLYSRAEPETAGTAETAESPAQSAADDMYVDGLLDLNAAGAEELVLLPGIGEVLAGRIIDYREEHGGFKSIEELLLVKGIGEKKYAELIKYITLNLDREDINENSGS